MPISRSKSHRSAGFGAQGATGAADAGRAGRRRQPRRRTEGQGQAAAGAENQPADAMIKWKSIGNLQEIYRKSMEIYRKSIGNP